MILDFYFLFPIFVIFWNYFIKHFKIKSNYFLLLPHLILLILSQFVFWNPSSLNEAWIFENIISKNIFSFNIEALYFIAILSGVYFLYFFFKSICSSLVLKEVFQLTVSFWIFILFISSNYPYFFMFFYFILISINDFLMSFKGDFKIKNSINFSHFLLIFGGYFFYLRGLGIESPIFFIKFSDLVAQIGVGNSNQIASHFGFLLILIGFFIKFPNPLFYGFFEKNLIDNRNFDSFVFEYVVNPFALIVLFTRFFQPLIYKYLSNYNELIQYFLIIILFCYFFIFLISRLNKRKEINFYYFGYMFFLVGIFNLEVAAHQAALAFLSTLVFSICLDRASKSLFSESSASSLVSRSKVFKYLFIINKMSILGFPFSIALFPTSIILFSIFLFNEYLFFGILFLFFLSIPLAMKKEYENFENESPHALGIDTSFFLISLFGIMTIYYTISTYYIMGKLV